MRQAEIEINFPVKKGDLRRPPAPLYTTIPFDTVENLKSAITLAIQSYHWENMTVKVSNLEMFSKEEIDYLEQYMLN
jgi:hypothetical protein